MARLSLALAVLAMLVGCSGTGTSTSGSPAAGAAGTSTTAVSFQAGDEFTMHVPTMHCPFACWPKVKETLEREDGVAEVVLAKQAEEDKLDNPRVIVRLNGQFDASKAVHDLAAAGFKDAAVEN